MALASFDDVKKLFSRPLSESQKEWVEAKLEQAELHLFAQIPTLEDSIENGEVSERLVSMTLCEAVIRVLKNPNSVRSTGVDDGQVTIDTTIASGRLYFLEEELSVLRPRIAMTGMYSIPLDPPYWDS